MIVDDYDSFEKPKKPEPKASTSTRVEKELSKNPKRTPLKSKDVASDGSPKMTSVYPEPPAKRSRRKRDKIFPASTSTTLARIASGQYKADLSNAPPDVRRNFQLTRKEREQIAIEEVYGFRSKVATIREKIAWINQNAERIIAAHPLSVCLPIDDPARQRELRSSGYVRDIHRMTPDEEYYIRNIYNKHNAKSELPTWLYICGAVLVGSFIFGVLVFLIETFKPH